MKLIDIILSAFCGCLDSLKAHEIIVYDAYRGLLLKLKAKSFTMVIDIVIHRLII